MSPWILDEQQVVGVQPMNLEVAVEEVLQVLQVEEELQVVQVEEVVQVVEELQVLQIQVEEELQVGEVLHAHCLLMQVLASLTKIFAALNCSMGAKASNKQALKF